MKMKKYVPEFLIIALLAVVSICGILSLDFSKSSSYINQYGDMVLIFGSGIYKADSYFKAPIFIGTDLAVLFFLVPLFVFFLMREIKSQNHKSSLHLISVESVSLYYAACLCFGVKYNRIFVLYVALFALLLFYLIAHLRTYGKFKIVYEMKKSDCAFLIFSGISLCIAWWPDIIPTLISGGSLKLIENYTTESTYVLDLGIISPLCFVSLYLMGKKDSLGTVIYSILLQSIIVVAVMMITQSTLQFLSGLNLPLAALISKSAIFVVLGLIAIFLNKRLYKDL